MNTGFPPRSGYDKVDGLVMFGRTVDKIRLHNAGQLPEDYNLGHGLDGRLCRFLRVDYHDLVERVIQGGTDEEILGWCYQVGRQPGDEEKMIFNHFMEKRGWRDDVSAWVTEQKIRLGFADRNDIQTAFDVHDADEKRK